MMGILESMGCVCNLEGHTLTIDAKRLICCGIPKEGGKAMRSSIILLGSLLGRCKEAVAYYPGGCSIGSRPIDLHLSALEKLGAKFEEEGEVIYAATTGLKGTYITLSYPSVGATENVLLAAVGAEGNTILDGAAMEPEVEDLCWMLEAMGANIRGIGTGTLKIQGGQKFHDIQWQVPGDRIVAGTYLSAVMAAGGKALFRKSCPHQLGCVIRTMREMGAEIRLWENDVEIEMTGQPKAVSVETSPYPGFPTDLQSMMMVLLSVGEGTGYLKEKVFEGRFATAKELHKMGADIIIKGREALITGQKALKAAQVQACDLRGGAALVVAGLAAEGETKVTDCHHILRGYEDICYDLKSLGAKIRREA